MWWKDKEGERPEQKFRPENSEGQILWEMENVVGGWSTSGSQEKVEAKKEWWLKWCESPKRGGRLDSKK